MLETAVRAAREAGHILARAYGRPHAIMVKGLRDITTEADLEAEQATLRVILADYPEARIVSEETLNGLDPDEHDVATWYVDPLDGTTNFARGLPTFCVSVAMAQRGRVECGAVYDPLHDHLFCAHRGGGAYLNNRRLHVSNCSDLAHSLVTLDWPRAQAAREVAARFLAKLAPRVDAVRSHGSAALEMCAVAAGWSEAYYQYTLNPWDIAAGLLIVEEAGGLATDLHGRPYRLHQADWLVSNGLVHEAILGVGPFS